jgi:hypothetical protein
MSANHQGGMIGVNNYSQINPRTEQEKVAIFIQASLVPSLLKSRFEQFSADVFSGNLTGHLKLQWNVLLQGVRWEL